MIALLVAPALAVGLDLSVGPELVANDRFLTEVGGRLGAVVRPLPWLGVGLALGGHPIAAPTYSARILEDVGIVPDFSPIVGTGALTGHARFAHGSLGDFAANVELVVGAGGVYTHDRCDLIQADDDAECLSTQDQVHPTAVIGLAASVERGRWGLRLRGERWQYTEIVAGDIKENKIPVWLGADVVLRFGGS